MDDKRNIILAVVLTALILFGWPYIAERLFPGSTKPAAQQQAAQQGSPAAPATIDAPVTIRARAGGIALWEGRAAFTVRADSPMAQTSLGSAKMAEALFKGFPGQSGETILVK